MSVLAAGLRFERVIVRKVALSGTLSALSLSLGVDEIMRYL